MAKKKTGQLTITQDAQAQSQQVFEQYHQVADKVRASTERQAAEAALAEINDLSEAAQFALLKSLVREKSLDAADLLLAINELSPQKSVRKEARRALIQLASAKIYPQWKPPAEQPLATGIQLANVSRRFFKGTVTDSLDTGEVQLTLAWEQGEDYKEIQLFGFLLEFWHDGVKDFFSHVMSKRSYENTAARMAMQMPEVKIKDCSLAEGRRLILDALAVNKKAGTQPHFEFRSHLSLINQLILEAPDIEEDTLEEEIDEPLFDDYEKEEEIEYETQNLSPEVVISTFVQAYFEGRFETSYRLLAADSPLREGLTEDEWAERRVPWFDEANPEGLEPNILWERPAQKSVLWLPNIVSASRRSADKVVEAGWSIEMDDTSEGDDLPELPRATSVYSETDRHWFWVSYTLVKEAGQWRIQYMVDEGTQALNLPTEELYDKIREHTLHINEITHSHQPTDANAAKYMVELQRNLFQSTSYIDALLARSYADRALYREAASRMRMFGYWERSLVYLEELTQRFEEDRAADLRTKGSVQQQLSRQFSDEGDDERSKRLLELAEEAFREALSIEDRFETRISLAEVLISREVNLDEAEDHLVQAKKMIASTDIDEEAHIEMHLGEIALKQERNEESLTHYRRVAELQPDYVDSWIDLGIVYSKLDDLAESDTSFRRAFELDPGNPDLYFDLSQIYSQHGRRDEGIEILKEGVSANPDSPLLNLYLASVYIEAGDYRQAKIFLDNAERLSPDSELVKMFRELLQLSKTIIPEPISFRPGKSKKKHR